MRRNTIFINFERNLSTQVHTLEIIRAELNHSTLMLRCHNANSELVIVMLPKFVTNLLSVHLISYLEGCFLDVCIIRGHGSFISITENMSSQTYPLGIDGFMNVIIEINGERIHEIHPLPLCRRNIIRREMRRKSERRLYSTDL